MKGEQFLCRELIKGKECWINVAEINILLFALCLCLALVWAECEGAASPPPLRQLISQ